MQDDVGGNDVDLVLDGSIGTPLDNELDQGMAPTCVRVFIV
jgi:hypothetical protein